MPRPQASVRDNTRWLDNRREDHHTIHGTPGLLVAAGLIAAGVVDIALQWAVSPPAESLLGLARLAMKPMEAGREREAGIMAG